MKPLQTIQLRPYQETLLVNSREALRGNKSILVSSPTGSGKSVFFSQITRNAFDRDFRVWVIVPLTELMGQTQRHFHKWSIPHNLIASGRKESRAFKIHIVSKQTLERRWNQVKNWPDLIIIDEAHVNYDFQLKLLSLCQEHTKIMGLTATPERLDGRGLNEIYQDVVFGPSRQTLVEQHYLSNVDYYRIPLEGLEELHKIGIDVKADELEALFKRRAIYGNVVEQWKETAYKKPTLAFCRNVAQAERWAQEFRNHGFKFECLEGKMKKGKRRAIVEAMTTGRIDGITSVNLISYGFDCPRVECILKLRPTDSKALNDQMDGRGMRTWHGKTDCKILDFVNNVDKHGHPLSPYEWNFYGKEKRKIKDKSADILRFCPKCYRYYTGAMCDCGHKKETMKQSELIEIDGRLVKMEGPVPLKERPYEEQKEFHDRLAAAKNAYYESVTKQEVDYSAIAEMIDMAESLGYAIMWVYHQLNNLEKVANIPLLHAIKHVKGYKQGWVYFKQKELRRRISNPPKQNDEELFGGYDDEDF